MTKIFLIGEAYGAEEERLGRPFVGASGFELDEQLASAGINRRDCFITNVTNQRPPDNEINHWFATAAAGKKERLERIAGRYPRQPVLDGLRQLQADLDRLQPSLIIALGNTPLWALTGETGILKWRGSIMAAGGGPVDGHGAKLIPTLHPAFVLREYAYKIAALTDLRRAKRESAFAEIRRPVWNFTIPRSFEEAHDWFEAHVFSQPTASLARPWPDDSDRPLVADVENIIGGDGHLICIGFAADSSNAICIPFIHRGAHGNDIHYWNLDDEWKLTLLAIRALKERPIIFHNGLHDCQIIARQWGILPRFAHDTMVGQHVLYPGMLGGKIDPVTGKADKKGSSLSLSFCASIYCAYYRHWKDDGREWDSSIHEEKQYWRYNCEDCVRTYEVFEAEQAEISSANLADQYAFEMELFAPVFEMMFRGIAFGDQDRRTFSEDVKKQRKELQQWIAVAAGHPLNINSTPAMRAFFYDDLQVPPVLNRKTRQPTTDSKTGLPTIMRRRPVLRPLIERIEALRSLDTYEENFLRVKTSKLDGRLRSSFNVAGVETFRFSSNVNAFGEGFNGQNLPREE